MDILPSQPLATPPRVALAAAIAGDAVADAVDPAELLDVDVDHLAGMGTLIAPDRLGRFECAELVEPQAPQDAADGCRREPELSSDLLAGPALPTQSFHLLDDGLRRRSVELVRS